MRKWLSLLLLLMVACPSLARAQGSVISLGPVKEDAAATSGERVFPIAAVRVSSCGTPSAGSNGDYIWFNVDASGNLCTAVASNAAGSTTDTDDGSIATGQSSVALVAGLQMYYNGSAWVRVSPSPCADASLIHTVAISQTADTKIISAASSKYNYLCSLVVVAGAAEVVGLVEGTGSTCGSSTAALIGSTTDANSMSFAANGGMSAIGGTGTIVKSAGTNVDICLMQSGSNRVAGWVTYAQATY